MTREVREGPQTQGPEEAIQYRIKCIPAPVSVVGVTVRDQNTGADVSADTLTGSAVISSGALVLPVLGNLEPNHFYEIEAAYSDGTSTIAPLFRVLCS